MEAVKSVKKCVSRWSSSGAAECRALVSSAHTNPSDPSCSNVLHSVYQTLISATLQIRQEKDKLTAAQLVEFIQSVIDELPSSSAQQSSQAATFGEYIIDMIWGVEAELEDISIDVKLASKPEVPTEILAKAKAAQEMVDRDRKTLTELLKKLLDIGVLSPRACRERLSLSYLTSIGLIADNNGFNTKEVRARTALFYKQTKFNLLREQSEGYSKLTTELTSSLGPPHNSQTARPVETYAGIAERARPVWEKIMGLIGTFDLDPNRTLDIILDLLSVYLTTHYTFFLALLSFSPWAGAYRIPEDQQKEMDTDVDPGRYQGKTLDEVLAIAAGELPIPQRTGPCLMAQVLGFKFAHYASANVPHATPKSLYLTAAILVREGFITLEELYPHLSPDDEHIDVFRKEYVSDSQSRISAAKNSQLAMAAPLESSSSSSKPSKPTATEKAKVPEPKKAENQKAGIVHALLSVGALQQAIAILTKYQWMVDAQPEIADLLIMILKHSQNPLYAKMLVTKDRNTNFSKSRARGAPGGASSPPPKRLVLTLTAPPPPGTNTSEFVFFFPDWTERVPLCSCMEDLANVVEPILRFAGLQVYRDALFLAKFSRLGRQQLLDTIPIDETTKQPVGEPDPDDPVRVFWFKVLRQYLIPALTLIRGNAVTTVEIWGIIKQYETTIRWRLYGEWKSQMYKSHPELRVREVQADREAKGILRRLSHNTIDALAGTVAKLAHSNPCILFANAVNQVMAYDNLANVVILSLRHCTTMGFDVLQYIILDAMSNPHKTRVKDDGVNTSDWLQSLASFTAMLARRYNTDITPLLKYIVHQLYNGQTTEIILLKELIWKMVGIEPLPSLSDSQVAAMAGGPTLRIEAIASATRGARLDPNDNMARSADRLGKALLHSELALPLLVQVAQQRQSCVFKTTDTHLKSLASLFDNTHGVLLQYLELLMSPNAVSPEDYSEKVVPPLADLAEKYGVCPPICMQIIRPILHGSLLKKALAADEQTQREQKLANEEAEKRLKAALAAKRDPSAANSRIASPSVGGTASTKESESDVRSIAEVEDTPMATEPNRTSQLTPDQESPWLPELSALFEDLKKVIPECVYDVIGPGFFTTFWQLSTYDLFPPMAKYEEEGKALHVLSRQEDSRLASAERSSDRLKRAGAQAHRQRRDRYTNFAEALTREVKQQMASRTFTIKRLAKEKQHWFAHGPSAHVLMSALIEHCIQPRCLLSPMDADYCAQIVKVIHTLGTPRFNTILCYDKLLGSHLPAVLFSCSEYEARNYGRFLKGVLTDIHNWHQDEALYFSDGHTKGPKGRPLPGFSKKIGQGGSAPTPWLEFQQVVRKWHRKINQAFMDCIGTGEFMHVYNTIIVLKEILPIFPSAKVIDAVGDSLNRAIDHLVEHEERGDLKILARAYSASLKRIEDRWAKHPAPKASNTSSKPAPAQAAGDKSRQAPPTGPSAQPSLNRTNSSKATPSVPSGPRAQNTTNVVAPIPEKPSKPGIESIQRPPVIRRVRGEGGNRESPQPAGDARDVSAGSKPGTPKPSTPKLGEAKSSPTDKLPTGPAVARTASPAVQSNREPPRSPRVPAPDESAKARSDGTPTMPPPAEPSQTASAQELRHAAKQSVAKTDKADEKPSRPPAESRSQNGSAAPSPRRRSPSPHSRPGTRNHSVESRRSRSDNDVDEKRSSPRDVGRPEVAPPTRRDSLTHTRREREKEPEPRDRDSVRDRGDRARDRDRHGDRDANRESSRGDGHREHRDGRDGRGERPNREHKDQDRDRDRQPHRDHRDRDRHRRDDKDRDPERERAKEDRAAPSVASAPTPTRGEPSSRHRNGVSNEDGLGKRRRPVDDESDRAPKRGSRRDKERDDRTRRSDDRTPRDARESDRPRRGGGSGGGDRRDRDGGQVQPDLRGDKAPPGAPSGPRAMTSSDSGRSLKDQGGPGGGREPRERPGRDFDGPPPPTGPGGSGGAGASDNAAPSLRSRISEKEIPGTPPAGPYHREGRDGPGSSRRGDDDRDTRKRTATDRDNAGSPPNEKDGPPKRPRIDRTRWTPHAQQALGRAKQDRP